MCGCQICVCDSFVTFWSHILKQVSHSFELETSYVPNKREIKRGLWHLENASPLLTSLPASFPRPPASRWLIGTTWTLTFLTPDHSLSFISQMRKLRPCPSQSCWSLQRDHSLKCLLPGLTRRCSVNTRQPILQAAHADTLPLWNSVDVPPAFPTTLSLSWLPSSPKPCLCLTAPSSLDSQ